MENTANILGLRILSDGNIAARSEILNILKSERGAKIFTPNPETLYLGARSKDFHRILSSASLLLPDGVGTVAASYLAGHPIKERVTGIDTAHWLLEICADMGLSAAFLGGRRGVADLAAKRLKKEIPALKITFTHHGYFQKFPSDSSENLSLTEKLKIASPDVVFVCFGSPDQERWIHENSPSIPSAKIFMGLGGSFDVWAGTVKRAPLPFQRLGLEWLYRCVREPKRFLRLLSIPSLYTKILFCSDRK